MRNIIATLTLAGMALLPVVALATEEVEAINAEEAIGISNLILIVGIGAVLAVGLFFALGRSGNGENA